MNRTVLGANAEGKDANAPLRRGKLKTGKASSIPSERSGKGEAWRTPKLERTSAHSGSWQGSNLSKEGIGYQKLSSWEKWASILAERTGCCTALSNRNQRRRRLRKPVQ